MPIPVLHSISEEDHGDLRSYLNERHLRKDQESQPSSRTKRLVKVVSENDAMINDDSPRQNGYDHYRGTSTKSDRGRRGSGDGRSPVWDPKLVDKNRYTNGLQRRPGANYQWRTETERKRNPSQSDSDSNSGNRSTRSTQSRWSERSYQTQTRYGQKNPMQGREINITQRERSQ